MQPAGTVVMAQTSAASDNTIACPPCGAGARDRLALVLGALGDGVGVGDAALRLGLVSGQVVLVVLGERVAG
jgi:hypothetical protein